MVIELYPQPTSLLNITSSGSQIWPTLYDKKEVNLRQEFYELLHGSPTEIAKGQVGILRRMRKDENNNLVVCPCVDRKTGEPDQDTICPYCWGEGYLWDEEWITYYKMIVSSQEGLVRKDTSLKPGISNIPFLFFYLEYNIIPTRVDKIIEVSLNTAGNITIPYIREQNHSIATPEPFRSDRGRIEYWRVAVISDTVKSSWQ